MELAEAQGLQTAGRYSALLRAAVAEQVAAHDQGRLEDETRWSVRGARACALLGRLHEGIGHAVHAAVAAATLERRDLIAEAALAQAILLRSARRYAEGARVWERAFESLPEEAPELTRALFELERAELAVETRNLPEARSWLSRGAARVYMLEDPQLLGHVLLLRSYVERPSLAVGQLAGALRIAESVPCPELEWRVLWQLGECLHQLARAVQAIDYLRRALVTVRQMAGLQDPEDVDSFWRESARARFREMIRGRYWPGFEEEDPAPMIAPELAPDARFNPALMPAFVQESLRKGAAQAGPPPAPPEEPSR